MLSLCWFVNQLHFIFSWWNF